ncbi:MAG: hypothetical protein [Bacteriophage sp.]|nr:MAG: hypothetical protein [Bacteriophage sp.]
MSIVMHPLTAVDGSPSYTADNYRHVVNPFLAPSDGTAFNRVSGVLYGAQSPLCVIDGLAVTVRPHCGIVSPWASDGAYTYAIMSSETVTVPGPSGNYKIAVIVEDPNHSHGSVPRGMVKVYPESAADDTIPGLVLAYVTAGVISDAAPVLHQSMLVEVANVDRLHAVSAADGQEALVSSTGTRYVRENGVWHDTLEVVTTNWLNGSLTFLYGADSCMVQVSGIQIDSGSWAEVSFSDKVKQGCRPVVDVSAALCVENGDSSTGLLMVGTDGTVKVTNRGGSGSLGSRRGSVSWPISRRY